MIPPKDEVTVCFAHVAYNLQTRFAKRETGIRSLQVWNRDELDAGVGEADVLVISGLWRNDLVEKATRLRFIQSIGAGTDQFGRDALSARGIRLARRLPEARDNQTKHHWRGMIGDLTRREDELGGKTLVIIGLGNIGGRLARLAKAFDMHVIGVRRDPAAGKGAADSVHAIADLNSLLPQADIVALTCPMTKETENLIDADALGRMKKSAFMINTARGKIVNEAALIATMRAGGIAGAAIDVTAEEPLPAESPLWDLPNTFITPHSAGETRRYEDNVLDILEENLQRLWLGEAKLRNQIV